MSAKIIVIHNLNYSSVPKECLYEIDILKDYSRYIERHVLQMIRHNSKIYIHPLDIDFDINFIKYISNEITIYMYANNIIRYRNVNDFENVFREGITIRNYELLDDVFKNDEWKRNYVASYKRELTNILIGLLAMIKWDKKLTNYLFSHLDESLLDIESLVAIESLTHLNKSKILDEFKRRYPNLKIQR